MECKIMLFYLALLIISLSQVSCTILYKFLKNYFKIYYFFDANSRLFSSPLEGSKGNILDYYLSVVFKHCCALFASVSFFHERNVLVKPFTVTITHCSIVRWKEIQIQSKKEILSDRLHPISLNDLMRLVLTPRSYLLICSQELI